MPCSRDAAVTRCRARVILGVAPLCLLLALAGPLLLPLADSRAEEPADLHAALREAARRDLPLDRRLEAVARVLRSEAAPDPEAALRAAVALMPLASEPACWLVLRATDAGWTPPALRAETRSAIDARLQALPDEAAGERARLAACGLLVQRREPEAAAQVTAAWPASPFVKAVVEREVGPLPASADATRQQEVRDALARAAPIASALDRATEDDPEVMRRGLDALVESGGSELWLLLHEARQGARGAPAGRMARAARAILALGFIGDRAATPVLADCLASSDGWVRVAAATALGDLGDPAGAVPLAVCLRTMGDLFRSRDQWDYPGASETSVPETEWSSIDYFAVDCAAADSLLRLGLPRAAGFLIHEKLDPSRSYFRVRVLQDAVDALRRALPAAPVAVYNVDAGLPQRTEAFFTLARWWHQHRDDEALLSAGFDEQDAGFRAAAGGLCARLLGKDVRQFMIAKPAIELVGPAMTATLVETLATATSGPARSELAQALALVRDPRAVPALLGLLGDARPFVRAAAATALGPYVQGPPEVQAALLGLLEDPKEGPRVSALKALAAAPPSDAVLAAVRALGARTRAGGREPSASYAMAERVVLLVQEGEQHWPAVAAGLADARRFTREGWWSLVRSALDLPAWAHDAKSPPDAPFARRLGEEQALEALRRRRSP